MRTSKTFFITGTDTGVGKTLVTALLALHLQSRGVNVGIMKPFATGCEWQNGELLGEDALWLKSVTGIEDDLELINPIRFEEPLAPLVAARRAGRGDEDFLAPVEAALAELEARHEIVLVEGVGGLLVPLQETAATGFLTCADLVNRSHWPVIVVARRMLGTVNHTILTCRTPLTAPAHFAGLIFSDALPIEESDIAAQTSPQLIAEMTGLPIWGEVPYLFDLSREALQATADNYLGEAFSDLAM